MSETYLFKNILLVEDDPSHAMLIKRALKDAAGGLHTSSSLKQAYQDLAQGRFDLIITDLNLPDSEGVKHVEELKQKSGGLPLLVLTSSSDLHVAIEAMKNGADEFIVKNFDLNFHEVLFLCLSRIYTGRLLAAEKIRIQKEMEVLRVAIESSMDAMAVLESNGDMSYANRAFYGFVEQCGGQPGNILQIFSPAVSKSDVLISSLKKNLAELSAGGVWHSELNFVDRKDLAFDLSLSAIGGKGSARENLRFVVWVKDIREQKRREKFQREILSTTTHDLKGPLGAILLSCELIENAGGLPEKAAQLLLRIESSARGATNLIDEFLSARRIQEGTFILKPAEHDMAEVAAEVAAEFKNMALARGIDLAYEPCKGGVIARADKLAFTRVLTNLLSNALKFTPKGGRVTIECEASATDYHLRVKDTGSGMDASEVNRIFERFSRLEKHSEIVGTGIGLFIVKAIVAAHGGKIEVTSTPGLGTTFDLSFPKNPPVNERGELISLEFT